MAIDNRVWLKYRLEPMFDTAKKLSQVTNIYSSGDIWSVKKELILHEYIRPYYNIIKKYRKKWFYYDPFCGSGLIKFDHHSLKGITFLGSPIITLVQNEKYPFTKYLISDISKKEIDALNQRIGIMELSQTVQAAKLDFETSICSLEQISNNNTSCLAMIDPVGIKEIPWSLIERILQVDSSDLIQLVNTSALERCLHATQSTNSDYQLTSFFGNDSWKKCNSIEELLKLYVSQIKDHKTFVEIMSIFRIGKKKQYDLILASKSKGGINAITDIKTRLDSISTEFIRDISLTSSGRIDSLDKWS